MPIPKDPIKRELYLKRQSESHRGNLNSAETRRKMSDSHKKWYQSNPNPHLGKPHTPEHNAKISLGLIGRVVTQKTRDKISKSEMGKIVPPLVCEKIKKIRLGTTHLPSTRILLSELNREENHPQWKGGVTPLMRRIRDCFKYREWRAKIFERDNFTCSVCGQRGGWKEADHYPQTFSDIYYSNNIQTIEQAILCQDFWVVDNGRTVCRKCHITSVHHFGRKSKRKSGAHSPQNKFTVG